MQYAVTHSCRESIRGAANWRQVNAVFIRHRPSASPLIVGSAYVKLRPIPEGNHSGSRDPFGPNKGWVAPHPLLHASASATRMENANTRNMKLTNSLTGNVKMVLIRGFRISSICFEVHCQRPCPKKVGSPGLWLMETSQARSACRTWREGPAAA